ncbi:MAG: helix-hairpin-helix domain-containing protein [Dysgonamonadaceae bacterium]|nr:helix-hairpin-helix domain-containing protein [Dysgonamonadaceae bacterium]
MCRKVVYLLSVLDFFLVFGGNIVPVFAQTADRNNSEWMRYLEDLAGEEEADNEALADLYDELSSIVENPYNLHTVTKAELEKLPFLSALQIENLLYYIYKYGPLVDIAELKNVEELDFQTIVYLLPFVYVGEPPTSESPAGTLRNLLYSKQELLLRTNFTVQPKAGYTEKEYVGNPYYGSFRYRFNYRDKLQLGVSGEKDPGEKGLDYTTFNLNFKDLGMVEALHFGNYRLSFGQGLVMNTNFSMGKTSDAVNINQKSAGIQRHVSTNESQYFSGVAGTLRQGNVRLHLFYSDRNQDATADDSTIYTWKTDGYHRTYNDLLKRETARTTLYGGNLHWQKDRWALGLTAVHYAFGGKTLNPDWKPYNTFYLRGKAHANAGFHYGYQSKKVNFQGETAVDYSGKIASISNILFHPAAFAEGVFSFRYYDKQYNALYGKGLSESASIQNETGFYSGIRFRMFRKWELAASLDQFIFPWLRYGIDTPSSGKEMLVQLKYNGRPDAPMELRYKFKEKQANGSMYKQHRWRYRLYYVFNPSLKTNTQIDYNRYESVDNHRQGWSWTQTVSYQPLSAKFQWDGGIMYFHTDDWNTRISIFEKNILYAFGFPTYSGQGLRYYAVVKWKIARPLTLYLKCGSTHYFDRETISSGQEAIVGREKTDIYCLIKYSF